MKRAKHILYVGLVVTFLIALFGLIKTKVNKSNLRKFDIDLEYYGVVDEVKDEPMSHGTSSFLINGEWVFLGSFGHSIRSKILPGDSISKVSGDDYLEIHRTSKNGYTLVQRVYTW